MFSSYVKVAPFFVVNFFYFLHFENCSRKLCLVCFRLAISKFCSFTKETKTCDIILVSDFNLLLNFSLDQTVFV